MLLGWASGHFGFMGVKAETTQYPALEYCSVAASFIGIILFIFVKPSSQVQKNDPTDDEASAAGSPTSDEYKKVCEATSPSGSKFPLLPEREGSEVDHAIPYSSVESCLLYTSDAADEEDSEDLGGSRNIKKKMRNQQKTEIKKIILKKSR
eukprot:TRINITY_DN31809_c0_g1_i1.p1 TRINITY_DN31809_c0_g1~~TRINITY_DN31809_c0_g1_i1.p1  ORF type:complete len:151 (+),score=40.29 TRINITY_DN31809_c0_g1_i1:191-643(+)